MTLSLLDAVEISPNYAGQPAAINGQVILSRIRQRAIDQWGEEKWLVNLVKEYVKLATAQGDEKATVTGRRPQIQRTFEVGSCTLDTAILLAAAVGCRFQLSCTTIEVEQF